MSVRSGLLIDRSAQIQHFNNSRRTEIKVLTDDLHKLCIRNLPCAERIYGYRRRLRYADGIRKLDLASSRKTCRNNIFAA